MAVHRKRGAVVTRSTTTTARVIWHTALSLDGFIAGADDDMQRVSGVDDGGGSTADDVVRSIGGRGHHADPSAPGALRGSVGIGSPIRAG